MNSCNYTRQIG